MKYFIIILFLVNINPLIAQETEEYVIQEEVYDAEMIEPESEFFELKGKLKEGTNQIKRLEEAFLTWNFRLLEPFLHEDIRKEVKSFFEKNESDFKAFKWKKRTHNGSYTTIRYGGDFGIKKINNSLRLQSEGYNFKTFLVDYYYYVSDSSLMLHTITSRRFLDKNVSIEVIKKMEESISSLLDNNRTKDVEYISNALKSIESSAVELSNFDFFRFNEFKQQLSRHYGNLSWYLIFESKFEAAVEAAKKGLKQDEKQTWIYTNLALSNLLAGNKKEALDIYNEYKNQYTNNKKYFREIFKIDLKEALDAKLLKEDLYNEILIALNEK